MAAAPFDTLKLARALRDKAGFSQEHAEAAADALAEVIGDQVATKQDIGDLRTDIAALRTEMRNEFATVRTEMQTEIATVRAAIHNEIATVRTEIAVVRTEMRNEFATVRSEVATLRTEMIAGFRDVEQRMTIRLGGMLVVITGILLAAKFFG